MRLIDLVKMPDLFLCHFTLLCALMWVTVCVIAEDTHHYYDIFTPILEHGHVVPGNMRLEYAARHLSYTFVALQVHL